MDAIRRKWWFVVSVAGLTVGTTLLLFWGLGLSSPFAGFSLAKLVLFFIAMQSFGRLYAWLVWSALLWMTPSVLGEKPLRSAVNR
jgi:hypothetical protein